MLALRFGIDGRQFAGLQCDSTKILMKAICGTGGTAPDQGRKVLIFERIYLSRMVYLRSALALASGGHLSQGSFA